MKMKKFISSFLAIILTVSLFPIDISKAADIDFEIAKDFAASEFANLLSSSNYAVTKSDILIRLANADKSIYDRYGIFVDKTKPINTGGRVGEHWEILGICPITEASVANHLYPPQYDGSNIDTWNWLDVTNTTDKRLIKEKTIFKDIDDSPFPASKYTEHARAAFEDDRNYSSYAVGNLDAFVARLASIMYVTIPPTTYTKGVGVAFHKLKGNI